MVFLLEETRKYGKENGMEIYLVGGAVRNRYLGMDIPDYDFAVSADCHRIAAGIADRLKGSYVKMHEDVGMAVTAYGSADFCNLKGDNIYEDLKKRDFTINSVAVNIESGEIIDVNGGIEDIKNKIIKAVYSRAFDDDPLRALRAVRLSASLGFEISPETLDMIKRKAELLGNTPGERIMDELCKILENCRSHVYIGLLDSLGILEVIFPAVKRMKTKGKCASHAADAFTHSMLTLECLEELIDMAYAGKWGDRIKMEFTREINNYPGLISFKLGAFLQDLGKPDTASETEGRISLEGHNKSGYEEFLNIAGRLNMSGEQRMIIGSIIKGHVRILELFRQGASDREIYRLFKEYGENIIYVLLASLADITASGRLMNDNGEERLYRNFIFGLTDRYYSASENKEKLVTGRDVIEILGLEGPEIGRILNLVDEEEFYGNIKTREEALNFIKTCK